MTVDQKILDAIVRLEERSEYRGKALDEIATDVKMIRTAQQVIGGEIEHMKSHCVERHARVSRDIETLRGNTGQTLNGISKIKQTWVTVVVIFATIGAIASMGLTIWRGFGK